MDYFQIISTEIHYLIFAFIMFLIIHYNIQVILFVTLHNLEQTAFPTLSPRFLLSNTFYISDHMHHSSSVLGIFMPLLSLFILT